MKTKKSGGWNNLNKFVYNNFKLSLEQIKGLKNYIWFASILFFCFALIGLLLPIFFQEQIINLIKELIEKTEGLSGLELVGFIMFNNIKSAFFAMIFGIFFAIIPFFISLVNGYVLGFVANKTVLIEGWLVLWRLLPHGIFEIPAIMISVALGLRLGMFLFISKNKGWKEFKKWVVDSLRIFIFIVIPLLVIAGIIEGILIGLL